MPQPKPHLNSSDIELLRKFFTTKEEFSTAQKNNELQHREIIKLLNKSIKATEKRIIEEIATSLASTIIPTQENHEERISTLEKQIHLTTN